MLSVVIAYNNWAHLCECISDDRLQQNPFLTLLRLEHWASGLIPLGSFKSIKLNAPGARVHRLTTDSFSIPTWVLLILKKFTFLFRKKKIEFVKTHSYLYINHHHHRRLPEIRSGDNKPGCISSSCVFNDLFRELSSLPKLNLLSHKHSSRLRKVVKFSDTKFELNYSLLPEPNTLSCNYIIHLYILRLINNLQGTQ